MAGEVNVGHAVLCLESGELTMRAAVAVEEANF